MKKNTNLMFAGIFNLIGGFCFILNSFLTENTLTKYLSLLASAGLIISGIGFLYEYKRNKQQSK